MCVEAVVATYKKQIFSLFQNICNILVEVEKEEKNGEKKFCQNYIFADFGRTVCKRLYGEIFWKEIYESTLQAYIKFHKKSHL